MAMPSQRRIRDNMLGVAWAVLPKGLFLFVRELLRTQILLLSVLEQVERERKRLEAEVAELKRAAEPPHREEFVSDSCILFRRHPGGGLDAQPCCPKCLQTLEIQQAHTLVCSGCVFYAPISAAHLPAILKRLREREAL
jgi:uncharacterized paraquat-inducible protein A